MSSGLMQSIRTVRASTWSPPTGRASATVRVDSLADELETALCIGVLTDQFLLWKRGMYESSYAWSYCDSSGTLRRECFRAFGLACSRIHV